MRNLVAGLMLGGMLFGAVGSARAISPGQEALLGLGAAAANTGYLPAKLTVAGLGLAVGSLVGVLTGGNERAAYGVWVPTAGGTYILTPSHFTGERPIEFFGSDYSDRPSTNGLVNNDNQVYDASYEMK